MWGYIIGDVTNDVEMFDDDSRSNDKERCLRSAQWQIGMRDESLMSTCDVVKLPSTNRVAQTSRIHVQGRFKLSDEKL